MKLLHVIANNFKNFNDSFEIDFYHDGFSQQPPVQLVVWY